MARRQAMYMARRRGELLPPRLLSQALPIVLSIQLVLIIHITEHKYSGHYEQRMMSPDLDYGNMIMETTCHIMIVEVL